MDNLMNWQKDDNCLYYWGSPITGINMDVYGGNRNDTSYIARQQQVSEYGASNKQYFVALGDDAEYDEENWYVLSNPVAPNDFYAMSLLPESSSSSEQMQAIERVIHNINASAGVNISSRPNWSSVEDYDWVFVYNVNNDATTFHDESGRGLVGMIVTDTMNVLFKPAIVYADSVSSAYSMVGNDEVVKFDFNSGATYDQADYTTLDMAVRWVENSFANA